MMRAAPLLFISLLAGCSGEANHIGNPLLLPLAGIGNAISNASYNQKRGRVEAFVKANHPALIAELWAGGGPTLTQAFDLANVPQATRAPHALQMQSDLKLYAGDVEALVVAIMVVSG